MTLRTVCATAVSHIQYTLYTANISASVEGKSNAVCVVGM